MTPSIAALIIVICILVIGICIIKLIIGFIVNFFRNLYRKSRKTIWNIKNRHVFKDKKNKNYEYFNSKHE